MNNEAPVRVNFEFKQGFCSVCRLYKWGMTLKFLVNGERHQGFMCNDCLKRGIKDFKEHHKPTKGRRKKRKQV